MNTKLGLCIKPIQFMGDYNDLSNIFLKKVISLGMHEIGHALGLGHHSPHADKHKKLCPMAKLSREYLTKRGYLLDNFDLYRRNTYCRNCIKQLKMGE
jgi:predicted Zn-dependent protease